MSTGSFAAAYHAHLASTDSERRSQIRCPDTWGKGASHPACRAETMEGGLRLSSAVVSRNSGVSGEDNFRQRTQHTDIGTANHRDAGEGCRAQSHDTTWDA
jgi:hypothetical protein